MQEISLFLKSLLAVESSFLLLKEMACKWKLLINNLCEFKRAGDNDIKHCKKEQKMPLWQKVKGIY